MRADCPKAPATVWDLSGPGRATVLRWASLGDTQYADTVWEKDRRATDTHGWKWTRVLRETGDCLYALGSPTLPLAALFGTRGKHLKLAGVAVRRLNYFQIAPELRGTAFARQALAVFSRFAIDAGAAELAISSLPAEKVLKFYEDIGGNVESTTVWEAPAGLVAVRINADTLSDLGDRADALEQEQEEI